MWTHDLEMRASSSGDEVGHRNNFKCFHSKSTPDPKRSRVTKRCKTARAAADGLGKAPHGRRRAQVRLLSEPQGCRQKGGTGECGGGRRGKMGAMAETADGRTQDRARWRSGRGLTLSFLALLPCAWIVSCAPEPDTLCPPDTPATCGNGKLEDYEMCDPLPQPHGTWREGVNCKSLANLGGRLTCRCCVPQTDMCIDIGGSAVAGEALTED